LTDDEVSKTGPVVDLKVLLAFKRLAPLLLLRATRADAWDDWAESEKKSASSSRDALGFGETESADGYDANDDSRKDSRKDSLGDLLLALTHTSSDAPDDARRLAAELHGRVGVIGAAAARVAAMESALDASRLGDARATALAALSGLASRGIDALGADSITNDVPSVRDRHRRAFVRMATFVHADARATSDGSDGSDGSDAENTKTEIAKTRAGGAETLARTITAELAETRAAPTGGLGVGLGDGARASATLDGVVAAIAGNSRAPAWAAFRRRDRRASDETQKNVDFDFERIDWNPTETRVALADALTAAARMVVGVRDRALAEAFARATYPTLAAYASSRVTNDERERERERERKPPEASARAACFSTCAGGVCARRHGRVARNRGARRRTRRSPAPRPGRGARAQRAVSPRPQARGARARARLGSRGGARAARRRGGADGARRRRRAGHGDARRRRRRAGGDRAVRRAG
jgi:hypothetical protein